MAENLSVNKQLTLLYDVESQDIDPLDELSCMHVKEGRPTKIQVTQAP